MKEKRTKEKHRKSRKKDKKHEKRKRSSSSSSSSGSDEWVEKESTHNQKKEREDWMAMTGMLKTYTKEDIHPKKEEKDKKHIDSYNPGTSSRELNPYWKDGGSGLPQTSEAFRQSRTFLKPVEEDDYYKKSNNRNSRHNKEDKLSNFLKPSDEDYYSKSNDSRHNKVRQFIKPHDNDDDYYSSKSSKDKIAREEKYRDGDYNRKSTTRDSDKYRKKYDDNFKNYDDTKTYNWKKNNSSSEKSQPNPTDLDSLIISKSKLLIKQTQEPIENVEVNYESKPQSSKYLSDEKMNKLAAKIVKAEILGDTKQVNELKEKLEAAREYRKQNPDAKPDDDVDDRVMLITTNSSGMSRPLPNTSKGDAKSKGGKRKADTHISGERAKYFGNDDKYNLAQMFTNEKYGNNYNEDAELARIASKSKNPNDDLEDIFVDEISKNHNEVKDSEAEKSRAIKQHIKMEKSLEGCEYCVDSKNMLKHLMVSCSTKVYVAVPARKSIVKDHCLITTIQHATCVTALDEDVWEEIMNYRKALTQFFNSQNKDVLFYETATRLNRFPHMVINCVPLPRDVGDMAAVYFKKGLLECEAEWSMNKKVVDLKGKNIRRGIPKGLPYFWIDFGLDPGFAHVIEDQQLFPKTFAEEIIAGILDLDHTHWKNPRKEYGDLQRKKAVDFINEWKPFDPFRKKE